VKSFSRGRAMGRARSGSQVANVNAIIAKLPPDAQSRISAVATAVRAMLTAGKEHEVELAITLVLAELSASACGVVLPGVELPVVVRHQPSRERD
jgi:hypothetical protein